MVCNASLIELTEWLAHTAAGASCVTLAGKAQGSNVGDAHRWRLNLYFAR
jgi:hypothetical protein